MTDLVLNILITVGLLGIYDWLVLSPVRRACKRHFELRPWYKFWKR